MKISQRKMGMAFSYVKTMCFVLVNIFLTPFLISNLGDSEYGIYQTMMSFGGYLVLINFGTGSVMTRYVSIALKNKDKKSEQNYIATCLLITCGLGIAILLLAVVLFAFLEPVYSGSMTTVQIEKAKVLYLFIAGNMLVSLFWHTFEGIINAYERFTVNNVLQIAKTVLKAVFIIAAFSITADSVIVVAVDLALTVLILIFNILYILFKLKVRWKLYFFDKDMVLSSSWFAIATVMQTVINLINTRVDITILGIMVDLESVTRYSVALQVFSVFASLSTAALAVYLPKFSRMCADGKVSGQTLTEAMIAPSRVQFLVNGTILFGFLVCGKDFIRVWMGENYSFSWIIAVIIMIPNFISSINIMVETALDAMGKRLVRSVILAGAAVCNVAVSVVLVHYFGEIGAPIGTAISTIIGSIIVMNIYYTKSVDFKIKYFFTNVFKGLLPALIIASLVTLPFAIFVDIGFVGLLIKGGVFVAALIGCLMLFGFNKDEKKLISGIFKR